MITIAVVLYILSKLKEYNKKKKAEDINPVY